MGNFVNVGENTNLNEFDSEKFINFGRDNGLEMMQQAVVKLMEVADIFEKIGLNIYNYNTLIIASDVAHIHTKMKDEYAPAKTNISDETYQNILKEIRCMSIDDEDEVLIYE